MTENKEMRYFSQIGGEIKGAFSVENAYVSRSDKKKNCFSIQALDRTYYMSAETLDSMKDWMLALGSAGCKLVAADDKNYIVKEGYLFKQTKSGKNNKRYFILYENKEMKYYSKQGGEQKGSIIIEKSFVSSVRGKQSTVKVMSQSMHFLLSFDLFRWYFLFASRSGCRFEGLDYENARLRKQNSTI